MQLMPSERLHELHLKHIIDNFEPSGRVPRFRRYKSNNDSYL